MGVRLDVSVVDLVLLCSARSAITTRTRRYLARITMRQRRPGQADVCFSSDSWAQPGGGGNGPRSSGLPGARGVEGPPFFTNLIEITQIDRNFVHVSPASSSLLERLGTRSDRFARSAAPNRSTAISDSPDLDPPADCRGPLAFGKIEIQRDERTRKEARSASVSKTTTVTPARAPFFS